jgi:autotransporter passenger strand-loop-strand repeat protein
VYLSGGVASGTTLNDGPVQIVSGGVASGTTINFAHQYVSKGTAIDTTLNGGSIVYYLGGVGSNTTVNNFGVEEVRAGGVARGTTVSGGPFSYLGGTELVFNGGSASGTTISGGSVEVASGGSATGVTFAGSGTLQLDDSVHFAGMVGGFSTPQDHLDLRDIAFGSGTMLSYTRSGSSGTLTVGTAPAPPTSPCSARIARATSRRRATGNAALSSPIRHRS